MKRITLGALDYGVAFGVDRTLRKLLLEGRISAVGCLVASELWPREFKPIREVAEKIGRHGMIGVTLAFSGDRVQAVSEQMRRHYQEHMPSRGSLERRAILRLAPDEILANEAEAQLNRFSFLMDREPDFVAVRDGLLDRTVISRLVVAAIEKAGYSKPPYLVSPLEPGLSAKRLVRIAGRAGLTVLPKARPLPEITDPEKLHVLLRRHFDGLADLSFVQCIPGQADDRLRREEPREKVAIRECQREVLASERFFQTLNEKNVFLN